MKAHTLAEKILLNHTEQTTITPGEIVEATIDVAMSHEMFGSRILPHLEKAGVTKVWDPKRLVLILDHWAPAPTVEAAIIHQRVRNFVRMNQIQHFYDVGSGICHQVLVEEGHVRPGELIVGTDSHTPTAGAFGALATGIGATDMAVVLGTGRLWFRVPETIKISILGNAPSMVMSKDIILYILAKLGPEVASFNAIEYYGNGLEHLSLDAWMTLTNMATEAGVMTALIPPDKRVIQFIRNHTNRPFKPVYADEKATYLETYEFDVSDLTPQVARPPLPTHSTPVSEVEGIQIDQALLGSCTNGRLEDLRIAAQIVKNKQVADGVRFIVTPASRKVYQAALEEGIIGILVKAGGVIGPPTCGACFGGYCGLLAPGEVCISTTNRNFPGRMGSSDAQIYLASPATVAKSALAGKIADPRNQG